MRPNLSELLGGAAMGLARDVLPALEKEPYARGSAAVAMLIAILAAQEANRAGAQAQIEIAAMQALFRETAAAFPPLAERLTAAAEARAAGLALDQLAPLHAMLSALLIELHAFAEAAPDAAIENRILAMLVSFNEAKALALPPMP
jgi:hypothetical protein